MTNIFPLHLWYKLVKAFDQEVYWPWPLSAHLPGISVPERTSNGPEGSVNTPGHKSVAEELDPEKKMHLSH